MTEVVRGLSGFTHERVIGSGTTLDTARLRFMLSDYFKMNPRNVHAYVIGEHGDSEFVAWSSAMLSLIPVSEFINGDSAAMNELEKSLPMLSSPPIKLSRQSVPHITASEWCSQGL